MGWWSAGVCYCFHSTWRTAHATALYYSLFYSKERGIHFVVHSGTNIVPVREGLLYGVGYPWSTEHTPCFLDKKPKGIKHLGACS